MYQRKLALPWLTLAVLSAQLLLGHPAALHADYTFTPIGDNTGPFMQPLHVGINNAGSVVVEWLLDSGSNSIDVYGPQARNVGFGGDESQSAFFNVAYPSLNNLGQVSLLGVVYSPLSLQVLVDTGGSKSLVRQLAETDAMGPLTSLNDSGAVACGATIGSVSGIWRSNTLLVQKGTNGFTNFLEPVLSNSGGAAFIADRSGKRGVYVANGSSIATIVDGAVGGLNTPPSINDAGQVSCSATLSGGTMAVYVGNGTSLTTIADVSGPFSSFSWTSINNSGQVAFEGVLDAGGPAIYLASTSGLLPPEKVIAMGDPLFGSTVTSLIIYNRGLNDSGQIAFTYRLANGVRGVAVADVAVPEPHSALLLLLPTVGLLMRHRRTTVGLGRQALADRE